MDNSKPTPEKPAPVLVELRRKSSGTVHLLSQHEANERMRAFPDEYEQVLADPKPDAERGRRQRPPAEAGK